MSQTIAEFLLARIAEDEAVALASDPLLRWPQNADEFPVEAGVPLARATLLHSRRWDPARVLAECEAKRRLVKLHCASHYCIPHAGHANTGRWYESNHVYPWPCPSLAFLALAHVYHPDYREEWRL